VTIFKIPLTQVSLLLLVRISFLLRISDFHSFPFPLPTIIVDIFFSSLSLQVCSTYSLYDPGLKKKQD
jgi:hypothetical protein